MKKLFIMMLVMSFLLINVGETFAKKYTIGTVVKLVGHSWFERMRGGVDKFAKDTGHETLFLGPPKASPAGQVKIIESLIAKGVDAICVVPFAPESLEMVLKKAMDKGIVVISHEASNQQNVHYDIEPFDNAAYGSHLMDHLAGYMNAEGEYAVFVGSLVSKTHNEWIDAAVARQKAEYPKMMLVTDRIQEYDDQKIAYQKTKSLLKQYPNLKGIQGSAMPTVPGAARAVQEKKLHDKVAVVGTGLVSVSRRYLESGAAKLISFWDPADAGYVMNKLAVMVLEGREITDGIDIGVPGYTKIRKEGKVLYGSGWIDVTKKNMADYNF